MQLKILVAAVSAAAVLAVAGNTTANAQTTNQTTKPEVKIKVQAGDSLTKIATEHQTTYIRMFDANPQVEHPDVIHPDQELRVPAADEQLTSRPLPATVQQVVYQPQRTNSGVKSTRPVATATPSDGNVWDRLAQCESGGNWSINTGNGYSGGLQFSSGSWRGVGGSGSAAQASREEQIARAEQLKAKQGWGAWPACSAKLGLR